MLNTTLPYVQWQTVSRAAMSPEYRPILTLQPTLHQLHSSYHEGIGGTREGPHFQNLNQRISH